MDVKMRKNKKAQLTIFIVIALIIVAGIALIFVIWRKPAIEISPSANPEIYIEKCMKDYTEEALEILMSQGGDIKPEGSVIYQSKELVYLCYNANFYRHCINQRPMLIEHIEQEITNYLGPKMRACFTSFRQELEKRNYNVDVGGMNITTDLQTRKVVITVERILEIEKNQETRKFEKFKVQVINPVYDIAEIAMEIANQEAEYCNFDTTGFMIIYPKWDIRKFRVDSDIIYTIKEVATNQEFKFAIRSCAMPAGF